MPRVAAALTMVYPYGWAATLGDQRLGTALSALDELGFDLWSSPCHDSSSFHWADVDAVDWIVAANEATGNLSHALASANNPNLLLAGTACSFGCCIWNWVPLDADCLWSSEQSIEDKTPPVWR